MNERPAILVAPRARARTRIAFVVIASIASIVHVRSAQMRTAGLLDHDEAISLLAAAGKSAQATRLYDDQSAELPLVRQAGAVQALLRPTGDTGFADVTASLRTRDIHPPLYFWTLHAIQRLGLKNETHLRLFGSILLLAAAVILDRLVWPKATGLSRLIIFAMILLSPTFVEAANELRHYAMLLPGVALSLAALVRLSEAGCGIRSTTLLIAIAPVLLMWTHLGSIVWIVIWSATLIAIAWRSAWPRRRAVIVGLSMAAASIVPLFVIYMNLLAVRAAGAHSDAISISTAMREVLANASAAFVALPWRFQGGWTAVVPLVVSFGAGAWVVRKRGVGDRLLFAAIGIWTIGWIVLLAAGKLPPHATHPKYLFATTIGILAVFMRSCTPRHATWIVSGLGLMLLSQLIALPQVLGRPPDTQMASRLHDVRTMLVNDPKRGYLLPIVEEMPASAKLIIMRPMRMPAGLNSTDDPLLVMEIKPLPGYPSSDDASRLNETLKHQHEQCETLADGPRRRLTLYRGRRH